jgi:hypothetical protein
MRQAPRLWQRPVIVTAPVAAGPIQRGPIDTAPLFEQGARRLNSTIEIG